MNWNRHKRNLNVNLDNSEQINQIADDFWQYSWNLYSEKSVSSVCIKLQDEFGANINALLLCCYLEQKAFQLNEQQLQHLLTYIAKSDAEIKVLREKRRKAKPYFDDEKAKAIYLELKREELEKEKQQQRLLIKALYELAPEFWSTQRHSEEWVNNLGQYELMLSNDNNLENQELKRHMVWLCKACQSYNLL